MCSLLLNSNAYISPTGGLVQLPSVLPARTMLTALTTLHFGNNHALLAAGNTAGSRLHWWRKPGRATWI